MQWELLAESEGTRTYALVFDTYDEIVENLTRFTREAGITAAHFTAIGALSKVTLAYYDWPTKHYHNIDFDEQVEVLMLAGDLSMQEDQPKVHAHCIVGRADGQTRGGHLVKGIVRPSLELVLIELPRFLQRTYDPESRLGLLKLNSIPGHVRKRAG